MIQTIDSPKKRHKKRPKITPFHPKVHQKPPLFTPFTAHLPEDVIFSEILTRLPVNSLTRFKSVSKPWNSTISTSNFVKNYLRMTLLNPFVPYNCVFIKSAYRFYVLNFGAYDRGPNDRRGERGLVSVNHMSYYDNGVNTFLIGSCNGLVCFGRGVPSSVFIYHFRVYNPVTGQFCQVLDPLGNFQWMLMYGFGYVSSLDDYVLFVGGLQRRTSMIYVYVYSLQFKTWKKIGLFSEAEMCILSGGRGVLVNETLHWDTAQVWTRNKKCLRGFDLVDEAFKDVRIPSAFLGRDGVNLEFKLCEIRGCLGAWNVKNTSGGVVEMWMLKEYGTWESWTNVFKIDVVLGLRSFCGWTESGRVLVQTDDGSLLLVDTSKSPTEYKSLVKDLGDIDAVSFVRSPVSPSF
ncbi:hypothetical protein vseg_001329 [Gypsophila vaccaria]